MENNAEIEKSVQNICEEHGGKLEWLCYNFKNKLRGKKIDLKEVAGMLLQVVQEHPEVVQYLLSLLSRMGKSDDTLRSTLDKLDDSGQQGGGAVCPSPEELYGRGGQAENLQLLIELATKLKLYRVENMGALLIVLYGLQLDYMQTEFSDVKQLIQNEHMSRIDTGWANYHHYLYVDSQKLKRAEARQWKHEYLMEAQKEWMAGIAVLERDVGTYVENVRAIASKKALSRIIFSMKDLDENMKQIKVCLNMLENVVPLACTVIGMNHGDAERFARSYISFFDSVIKDNISMLENYCQSEDRDYWEQIRKNGSQVIAGSCMNMTRVIDKL